ncbi:hypothetical protein N9L38_04980 [Candidatus Poseidoniales archaeon]|nr:hypothetical protein [Candidatus Poseidoniales archaeon]
MSTMSAAKNMVQEKMRNHIKQMVSTNPMIGQLNEQFTSWLLGSGLTGAEIANTIDSNNDAVIQPHELSAALEKTTGTSPPAWVINGLLTLLDSDNDKTVTVGDLFTYFEQIGLPLGIPDPAETARITAEEEAARFAAEQKATRLAAEQKATRLAAEQEAARIIAEQELEKSMQEIDIELEEVPEVVVNEVMEETKEVVEVKNPVPATTPQNNPLEIIEALNSMKLSSEIRDAVEKTTNNHHFSVKIEKIESTIIAPQSFKNGKTIIGTLVEDNSVEIELLFQPEANDSVSSFQMNHIVEIDAHIANWNIGRKRPIFSVHSYEYN